MIRIMILVKPRTVFSGEKEDLVKTLKNQEKGKNSPEKMKINYSHRKNSWIVAGGASEINPIINTIKHNRIHKEVKLVIKILANINNKVGIWQKIEG